LIAANWGAMAKSVRMLAALVLIWLTFGGVIIALERKANWIGHAFALAGALAIGAAVSLIGQTYNIEGSAADLFLVWALGALATAIAFRSTPVLILYVILAVSWFALARPEPSFIFDGGRASERSWGVYGLGYLPLWFAGAFLGRRVDSGAAMHISGLNFLIWMLLLFGDAVWAGGRRDWMQAGLMLAGASAVIGAGGERTRARAGVLTGLAIAQFAIWDKKDTLLEMAFAAASLALSTWAITWGDTPGRRAARGLAVALFAFECFYVYAALFKGLLDTSLFLLGGGALLFALAFGMRFLTRKKPPAAAAAAAP
jgi:uncharacterized membrane protein